MYCCIIHISEVYLFSICKCDHRVSFGRLLALFLDPWCSQEYQFRGNQIKYCNWSPLDSDFFADLEPADLGG